MRRTSPGLCPPPLHVATAEDGHHEVELCEAVLKSSRAKNRMTAGALSIATKRLHRLPPCPWQCKYLGLALMAMLTLITDGQAQTFLTNATPQFAGDRIP